MRAGKLTTVSTMSLRGLSLMILGLCVLGAGCTTPLPPSRPQPDPPPAPAPVAPGPDWVALAPASLAAPLARLVEHRQRLGYRAAIHVVEDERSRGADAVQALVRSLWTSGGGALRYLLLVGDVTRDDEPAMGRIPTFYLHKLEYGRDDHNVRHPFHRSLLHAAEDDHFFPSDEPYAIVEEGGGPRLYVGRLPARTGTEVEGFVKKLIAYETALPTGDWRRRVLVRGGPARFGPLLDGIIEQIALDVLDQIVPYDFDVDVVFAKPGSEYGYRPDRLGPMLVEQAERGAFLMAYVGHSSPAYFDTVDYRGQSYSIGSRADFEQMRIAEGAPIFVSLSCDVGALDMSRGRRSIAEEAVLNPTGAIASFAASRVSHPYPNLLYGEALIEQLLGQRHETLGEAIHAVRVDMQERSNLLGDTMAGVDPLLLKREHAALYLLFGDPATRLRHPATMQVSIAAERVAPGAPLAVRLSLSGYRGIARVSIETRRRTIRHPLVSADQIEELPIDEALQAMADNYAKAIDKIVARGEVAIQGGAAVLAMTAPSEPGEHVIKVLAHGPAGSAWGHVFFEVVGASP